VSLPYRPPFDWHSLIEFLEPRTTPGVEAIEADVYRRTIEIRGHIGMIEVWHEAARARLCLRVVIPSADSSIQIVQRVRRMFDLAADTAYIGQQLSQDAQLAKLLVKRPGLRVPGAWDGFELAVRAVLGQQLTAVDNPDLIKRLVRTFGQPINTDIHGLTHLFPRPEILAEMNLTNIGVPDGQAETIRSLARAVFDGKLIFNSSKGLRDTLSSLQTHPGLSQGTASYIAMRGFGEPDALPYADRGLRQGLVATRGGLASPAEMLQIFKKFKPWRAYAAMHLSAPE
jgi:AraC family transcriptional regulator of adaptative response / DNA-3-methyladenine glycosylase II